MLLCVLVQRRVLCGKGGSSMVSEVVGAAMRAGADSPLRQSISAREVQEASRILFTPAASRRPPSPSTPHHMPPRHPGAVRSPGLEHPSPSASPAPAAGTLTPHTLTAPMTSIVQLTCLALCCCCV